MTDTVAMTDELLVEGRPSEDRDLLFVYSGAWSRTERPSLRVGEIELQPSVRGDCSTKASNCTCSEAVRQDPHQRRGRPEVEPISIQPVCQDSTVR